MGFVTSAHFGQRRSFLIAVAVTRRAAAVLLRSMCSHYQPPQLEIRIRARLQLGWHDRCLVYAVLIFELGLL